jgi:hypothetical protein
VPGRDIVAHASNVTLVARPNDDRRGRR